MLLELLLAIFLGIIAGTITGLIPGIHINLIGASLASIVLALELQISPIYLVIFIAAMAIAHTFIDFIPSVFLGCPDTDTELSILPGHQLLKKGMGYQAVILTCYGSLAAIIIIAALSLPLIFLKDALLKIYDTFRLFIPGLLVLSSLYLISREKRKLLSFSVFIMAGVLGWCVLNFSQINQPLLPLLTGLFGGSTLVLSIKNKTQIPSQKISRPKEKILKPLLGAVVAAPLCSFLPGLGSGQAAIIGNSISKTDTKGFLILLGATNTLVMGVSFITLYLISKTRTGAAVVIKDLLGSLDISFLLLILGAVILSGIISFFWTRNLAELICRRLEKVNYAVLSACVLLFLGILAVLISGLAGLLVLIVSTLTGIYAITSKVRRTNMMGCLIIPTIVLYLF